MNTEQSAIYVPMLYQGSSVGEANKSNSSFSVVNDVMPIQAYFDSLIENISLPFTNIIYPFDTISNPFDNALVQYLAEDIHEFQTKLESFHQAIKGEQPSDFTDKSYEDLLNTPVDTGAEDAATVSQQTPSAEINSQGRELYSSSNGATTSSINNLFTTNTNNPFEPVINNNLNPFSGTHQSFTVGSENYIANVNQGAVQAPSALNVNEDPDGLIFQLTFGNDKTLLSNVVPIKGDTVMVDGVSISLHGPFLLTNNVNVNGGPIGILLNHAEITTINNLGEFIYVTLNHTPEAGSFFFQVTELQNGIPVDQKVGTAYISEIQNESFNATLENDNGVYTAQGHVTLQGNSGLLANDVAAGSAVLSIIDIDPVLNSVDPTLDTFDLVAPSASLQTFNNFNIGGTSLSLLPDGTFSFSTTSITPLTLSFIVSDGLGETALASATFTPTVIPVVLDLSDNGINLVSAENSHMTVGALTSSNNSTQIGWIGDGNAVLMYDANGSGKLTNLDQISFVSYVPGAQTDLAGLAAFDSNHNGYLDKGDLSYNQFGVLLPNGKFESLGQLGIVSISLNSDNKTQNVDGNTIFGETTYQTANGVSHTVADVGFGVSGSIKGLTLTTNDVVNDNNQLNLSNLDKSPSSTQTSLTNTVVQPTPAPVAHDSSPASAGPSSAQEVAHISEQLTPNIIHHAA